MQQELIHERDPAGQGSLQPLLSDKRPDSISLHRIAGIFHNAPSPSEKLTDATLPLTWPAPYLEQLSTGEASRVRGNAASSADSAAFAPAPEDYAQLMRKLKAESIASQAKPQIDKALCVAHYVSTLLAALAFIAMMAILIVTFFPGLLPSS